MLYAAPTGWLPPTRLNPEAGARFAVPFGSISPELHTIVPDNPRLDMGMGCAGDRQCGPCAAKAAASGMGRLVSLGGRALGVSFATSGTPEDGVRLAVHRLETAYAMLPANPSDALEVADLLAKDAEAYGGRDAANAGNEGAASLLEAQGVIRQAAEWERLAQGAVSSGWWDTGAERMSANAFRAQIANVKTRMEGRLAQGAVTQPALTPAEAAERGVAPAPYTPEQIATITDAEQKWADEIERENQRSRSSACSPLSLLTAEQTMGGYWQDCVPGGFKVGLAALAAILVYGAIRR